MATRSTSFFVAPDEAQFTLILGAEALRGIPEFPSSTPSTFELLLPVPSPIRLQRLSRAGGDSHPGSASEATDKKSKARKADAKSRRPLACPFFKRYPQKYMTQRTCAGPGWHSMHRLKWVSGTRCLPGPPRLTLLLQRTCHPEARDAPVLRQVLYGV